MHLGVGRHRPTTLYSRSWRETNDRPPAARVPQRRRPSRRGAAPVPARAAPPRAGPAERIAARESRPSQGKGKRQTTGAGGWAGGPSRAARRSPPPPPQERRGLLTRPAGAAPPPCWPLASLKSRAGLLGRAKAALLRRKPAPPPSQRPPTVPVPVPAPVPAVPPRPGLHSRCPTPSCCCLLRGPQERKGRVRRRLPSPACRQPRPRPSCPPIGWEESAIGAGSRQSPPAAAGAGLRAGRGRVAQSGPGRRRRG